VLLIQINMLIILLGHVSPKGHVQKDDILWILLDLVKKLVLMVHMQMIELCIAKLVVPQITLPIQVLIDVF